MKVRTVEARAYSIPTDQPEADGTMAWDSTTMVVVRVSDGDHCGLGWTYTSSAAVGIVNETLADVVQGGDTTEVPRLAEAMARACRNLGRPGVAACAISAVDVALWDLRARQLDIALCDLFGRAREEVPVYGSGGFTTYDDDTTRAQLQHWVQELGIPRVKIKIGEAWGSHVARDLHRVGVSRKVIGEECELYVDANGAYSAKGAVRFAAAMADLGVTWFEEPVSSDDLDGLRFVRNNCACDVTAGEYGYTLSYFGKMLAAGAVDCLQADVTRCGGYTVWRRVAALAESTNIQISGHCAPNLHAHVAMGVPNLRHLEYFHDHHRIETKFFEGALSPQGGSLVPDRRRPGNGLQLREADLDPFRVA